MTNRAATKATTADTTRRDEDDLRLALHRLVHLAHVLDGMLEGVGEGRVHVLLGLHRGDLSAKWDTRYR